MSTLRLHYEAFQIAEGRQPQSGTSLSTAGDGSAVKKINYPGTGNYSQLIYDGRGKCMLLQEASNGSVTALTQFLYIVGRRAETRNQAGTPISMYFANGQMISGTGYFCTRDAIRSVRELTNASSVVESLYSYDPFGRVTQLSGSLNSDFQFADYYIHEQRVESCT